MVIGDIARALASVPLCAIGNFRCLGGQSCYGYGMARRILPLASILPGAGLGIYGLAGLYKNSSELRIGGLVSTRHSAERF